VRLEASELGPAVDLDVPVGARLLDACDETQAQLPVAFACRSASCGTCLVVALAGLDQLSPPNEGELEVLEVFQAGPRDRLACQLTVLREGDCPIRLVRS
jgi:2Fe-2S ferredoxin